MYKSLANLFPKVPRIAFMSFIEYSEAPFKGQCREEKLGGSGRGGCHIVPSVYQLEKLATTVLKQFRVQK